MNPALGTRTDTFPLLPSSGQAQSCGVQKPLAATPGFMYVFWNAKNGHQCKVWPEKRLQECYVVCLYFQTGPVWDVCLTKLKRFCRQVHTLFYDFCAQISLSSINSASQMVFHPIRPQHSRPLPLCNQVHG